MLSFRFPSRNRAPWIAAAVCCMLGSSYSVERLLGIADFVSAWTGIPRYADQIRKLNQQAPWWEISAVSLILLAALLLGCGIQTQSDELLPATEGALTRFSRPEEWILAVLHFIGRLVISVLGTLGLVVARALLSYL